MRNIIGAGMLVCLLLCFAAARGEEASPETSASAPTQEKTHEQLHL